MDCYVSGHGALSDHIASSATADDGISRNFQKGLNKLGVDWPPGLVVSTLELVETYVAEGFGFGAGVVVPELEPNDQVRQIPLPDFPPLMIGAVWAGTASPLVQTLVSAFQRYAQTFTAG